MPITETVIFGTVISDSTGGTSTGPTAPENYVLPTATHEVLGGVIVGPEFHVTEEGVLTTNASVERSSMTYANGRRFTEQGYTLYGGYGTEEDSSEGYAGEVLHDGKVYFQDHKNGATPYIYRVITAQEIELFKTAQAPLVFEFRAGVELDFDADVSSGYFFVNFGDNMGLAGSESYFTILVKENSGYNRVEFGFATGMNYNITEWAVADADYARVEVERDPAIAGGVNVKIYRLAQDGTVTHLSDRDFAAVLKSGKIGSFANSLGWLSGSSSGTGIATECNAMGFEYDYAPALLPDYRGIVTLKPEDDIVGVLAAGARHIELIKGEIYTFDNVVLPSGTYINGNFAHIKPSGLNNCFILNQNLFEACVIENCIFTGTTNAVLNQALVKEHVAIKINRSYRNKIRNNLFINWQGAGITVQGSSSDTVYKQANEIKDNTFETCWCGVSATDRSEFSTIIGNNFYSCRVAVINTSGNWAVNDNIMTTCTCAYFSVNMQTPWGALSSDNWGHGTFSGNKINHSNSGGGSRWSALSIPCGANGATSFTPTGAIFIDGTLPPTICGITAYYSTITINKIGLAVFSIVGAVLSNCSVVTDVAGKLKLAGCSVHASVTFTNVDKTNDCFPPLP